MAVAIPQQIYVHMLGRFCLDAHVTRYDFTSSPEKNTPGRIENLFLASHNNQDSTIYLAIFLVPPRTRIWNCTVMAMATI